LENPSEAIFDVIRYFGTRNRIFNVHFRNIRGRRDSFQEIYPDEGDLDMFRILRTLRQVRYSGMLMPDHIPTHPDDRDGRQGLAFAFGYMKGLIQAVYAEPCFGAPAYRQFGGCGGRSDNASPIDANAVVCYFWEKACGTHSESNGASAFHSAGTEYC
jgi:hypothetical protein